MVKGVSCKTVGSRPVDPAVLSRIECALVVSRRLGRGDFELVDVEVSRLGGDGLGFMSEQFAVTASVRMADGSSRSFRFFTKTLPLQNRLREDFVAAYGCFRREVAFYSTIAPLLKAALPPNGRRLRSVPDCYFSTKDTLVFEDLTEAGFRVHDAGETLDYDHAALVLKNLAALHAASIIHENVIESQQNIRKITDCCAVDLSDKTTATVDIDGRARNWFNSCAKTLEPLVKMLPKYKDQCDQILSKLPCLRTVAEKFLVPSEKVRNVICHGDLWTSNLLFRYDGSRPTEVRFVDFQMVRYLPPSTDVVVFLHLAMRQASRQVHQAQLLDEYYEELRRVLLRGGVQAETVLPRSDFLESCEAACELGRAVAAAFCPTMLIPAEHTERMLRMHDDFERLLLVDRGQEARECFLQYPLYRERVTEVIQEFVDHCILESRN